MKDLQQLQAQKLSVLKLKMLLHKLRDLMKQFLPENPTTDQISKTFGLEWHVVQRFWFDRSPGGEKAIRTIKEKISDSALCEEILELIRSIPDIYKAMVPYSVDAIVLAFDLYEALGLARNQTGVLAREQMDSNDFSAFFGQHSKFVHDVVTRNTSALTGHNAAMDDEIRLVLFNTDWTTVRPAATETPPKNTKAQELEGLLKTLRTRFPSEWALHQALPAHRDSIRNALSGKGKPSVVDYLLEKARRLLSLTKESSSVAVTQKREVKPSEKSVMKEPHQFLGSFISSISSNVRMVEEVGIDPELFTDGHRDNLLRVIGKLMTIAKIDAEALNRLTKAEGLSADDPSLKSLLSALNGARR